MNRKFLLCLGLAAIALAYVLNVSHAIDNYGMTKSTLENQVLAQSGTYLGVSAAVSGASNFINDAISNVSSWWDSKDNDCVEETCTTGWSIGVDFFISVSFSSERSGKYMKCIKGSSFAHCWDCSTGCDASL